MTKLTAIAVANARPGHTRREIHDRGCPGLFLVVQPTGHKSWAVRYRFRGLSRKLTLGPVLTASGEIEPASEPQIDTPLSLMAARELAIKALRQAKAGVDPVVEKRQKRNAERAADANTLQAVCDTYLELVQREKPMRTIDQRRADLALICKPLGQLPLDIITREQFIHVFDVISKTRGPVRADRVLMAMKRLLKWYSGRRSNYFSVLANVGRRISIKDRARTRVLSDPELRALWLTAEKYPAPFGPYLRFLLLTATRRDEAAGMRRSELLDPARWVIPASRYKTNVDVLLPLSKATQEIIHAQPEGEFIFPAKGGRGPLDSFHRHKKAFDAVCGIAPWRIHDLRRSARTLLSRAGISADVGERCLGHVITGVRAHYDMHEYEKEKRHAFEALAALIERITHPPAADIADLAAERGKRRGS
jgi:integrase